VSLRRGFAIRIRNFVHTTTLLFLPPACRPTSGLFPIVGKGVPGPHIFLDFDVPYFSLPPDAEATLKKCITGQPANTLMALRSRRVHFFFSPFLLSISDDFKTPCAPRFALGTADRGKDPVSSGSVLLPFRGFFPPPLLPYSFFLPPLSGRDFAHRGGSSQLSSGRAVFFVRKKTFGKE